MVDVPAEFNRIVHLEEDVVAAHCNRLRELLRAQIEAGANQLTLDFREVRMVDSAGIGLLIATHNTMRRREGELALINCSLDILELFRTMRLDQHMRVEGKGESKR
jgi:anti-anti-sigma factor